MNEGEKQLCDDKIIGLTAGRREPKNYSQRSHDEWCCKSLPLPTTIHCARRFSHLTLHNALTPPPLVVSRMSALKLLLINWKYFFFFGCVCHVGESSVGYFLTRLGWFELLWSGLVQEERPPLGVTNEHFRIGLNFKLLT